MPNKQNDDRTAPTTEDQATQEAVTKLIRVADEITRFLEQVFARFGLTGPQYNVLRILRGAGGPVATMEVAGRMLQKTPAVTGILDRLEKKGLVKRERSAEDRRVWFCSITGEGQKLIGGMGVEVRKANRDAVRGASQKDLRELAVLLDRIRPAEQE